jgi:hypothetical protein
MVQAYDCRIESILQTQQQLIHIVELLEKEDITEDLSMSQQTRSKIVESSRALMRFSNSSGMIALRRSSGS